MPSITREQFNRWNAKAVNGFAFDLQTYCVWGEKSLCRYIHLDDDHKVELHVEYRDEYETRTSPYGCKYQMPTGRHIPELHVSAWTRSASGSGMFVSHGLGRWFKIGEPQTSKKYDVLCKLAATINADDYVKEVA